VLVLVALVLLAPACAGESDSETSPDPLTPAELGWMRVYAAWTIDIYNGELGPDGGPLLVKECLARREKLGDAPSERLEPAAERAAAACPLLAHRGMHRRALDAVDEADDLIRPLLLEVQPLPLESGQTKESRADLDTSGWLTRELERPAEVRCWDDEDWPRVIEEGDAWTDDHTDVDDLYGWADDASDRIHMRLDQCNLIAAFRAHESSKSRAREIETASALGTLFHEATHLEDMDLDEAEVECEVLYWFDLYAWELGGDTDRADRLARIFRTEVYPDQPEEYISDCDE
jgi:hypothetical protein